LVIVPLDAAVAVIFKVAFALFDNEPTIHIPVTLLYAPAPVSDTYVNPDGNTSFTLTFEAFPGPEFETVTVNTTFESTTTVVEFTDFTMLKSAVGAPSSSSEVLELSPGVELGSD